MPRRPRIPGLRRPGVLTPTRPARPEPAPPRPSMPVAPAPRVPTPPVRERSSAAAIRRQTDKVLSRVRKRLATIDREFHAIGVALAALDRDEVFDAYDVPDFKTFLNTHVMPASSAYRFMAVAEAYEAEQALSLGVEKSYQLIQYLEAANVGIRPSVVARGDRRLGSERRRVSELSARDLEVMARSAKLQLARAAIPKATRKETRAAKALGLRLAKSGQPGGRVGGTMTEAGSRRISWNERSVNLSPRRHPSTRSRTFRP